MPGDAIFLAGSGFNLLNGATISITGTENSLYTKAHLYDDDPAYPFKWNAAGANDAITIDLGSAKSVDFCSIHGHNIDSGITAIQLRSSTDNFSSSDDLEATMSKANPAFKAVLSSAKSRRYWRVKFVGTNGSPISIGELVLGDSTQQTRSPQVPWTLKHRYPQIRNVTRAGTIRAYNLTDDVVRVIQLNFKAGTSAMEQVRDSIYRATLGGALPLVYVPDSQREEVVFGHIKEGWDVERLFDVTYSYQLIVEELPMGLKVT